MCIWAVSLYVGRAVRSIAYTSLCTDYCQKTKKNIAFTLLLSAAESPWHAKSKPYYKSSTAAFREDGVQGSAQGHYD